MYATVLIMRWYEVQSDMMVDWCSVADAPGVAATARSAVGRTAVTSGPEDAIRNGLDDGTGKEAEGFRTMVLPELGGREVKETPWPRGGPRYSARALLGRASQSIEDKLHHDKCHAVSRPRLFRTPHCRTSRPALDATGSQEASVPTWNSRMLWQFGESHAREPSLPPPTAELRTSSDI